MAALQQTLRDNALYAYGYLSGRSYQLPHSLSGLYAASISKVTSFISLPLPLLSFLALPVFGGTSTSVNLLLFYLTWSSLVLTHDPLSVELYGALAVRVLLFLLPAIGFLAFDVGLPSASKAIKAYGTAHLPSSRDRVRLARIAGVAVFNATLSTVLQAALEYLATDIFHTRSILKVTTTVPLPWTIATDLLKALALRGILHYAIHRHLLHTYHSPLRTWHRQWQHSVRLPFSIAAYYDHPACHLLAHFLPTFLPAYALRLHVLTYHLLLAITSLETLFLYSGYAVLPSSIVLAGMARRTDMHFATVAGRRKACNFGHWGVLDLVCGTYCKDTSSMLEDLQDEAEKHRVEARAEKAAGRMVKGLQGIGEDDDEADGEGADGDPDGDLDGDHEPEGDGDAGAGAESSGGGLLDKLSKPVNRRSGRNRPRRKN